MSYFKLKGVLSLLLFVANISCCFCQVKTKIFNDTVPTQFLPISKILIPEKLIPEPSKFTEIMDLPKSNNDILKEYSNKFAIPLSVNLDVMAISKVSEENNSTTYSITLNSGRALNVSLQFDKFILSEHSILSIYTNNELTDSITAKENNKNNIWATRVYQGSKLTIVLKLPTVERTNTVLKISQINFGYKKYGSNYYGKPGASAPCNINVLCPEGDGWQNERNSVALIVANGIESCTGTLIMNTCGFNVPYLLTANHCLGSGNIPNWVFQFQYWSATCNPNTGWREDIQFNGCTLRASSAPSDFALLELNQIPQPTSGIFYSGWSNSSTAPANSVSLHHPAGDLMKISRDFNSSSTSSWGGNNNHWFDFFDQGIVQPGSSGAPLFDQNHRIVGQLHGYQNNICAPSDNACFCSEPHVGEYGRFDLSWTGGGTNDTRLSNWLDPSNSGTTATNTTNISNLYPVPINGTYVPITGNTVVCGSSQIYTINSVPPDANVVWRLNAPIAAGGDRLPFQNICTLSSVGNQATLTKIANGNVQLFATITNCVGATTYAKADIAFGVPSAVNNGGYWKTSSFQPITGTVNTTDSKTIALNMAYSANTNNQYTWYKTSGSSNASWNEYNGYSGYGVIINFTPPVTSSSNFGLNITTSNACGSTTSSVVMYYQGPGIFMASPNPSNSSIHIQTINSSENLSAPNQIEGFDRIEVVDKTGKVVLRKSYQGNTKSVDVNISLLHSDYYILRIFNRTFSEEHKIIVQH